VFDPGILINQELGEYAVMSQIGEGAFSYVYEAIHKPTGARVALKILKFGANLEQRREFTNEAQLLVGLSHSSRVIDIINSLTIVWNVPTPGGAIPLGVDFHVLEIAEGNLAELVVRGAAWPWSERLDLFRDIVLGVHQMHLAEMAHRDLKAANCLLVQESPSRLNAKVSDLGRSRNLRDPAGAPAVAYNWTRGDPTFSPPELLWLLGEDTRDCHMRADLYGLGSLLFELAVGQGFTALSLYPYGALIVADHALARPDRLRRYRSRFSEIRGWYASAATYADAVSPPAIQHLVRPLIMELCDPDPARRTPRGFRRRPIPLGDLCWLLNKVDIMRLTLMRAQRQEAELARKKALRRAHKVALATAQGGPGAQ
jgi:eukaryotic-like serine/threonine-protein kinase